MAPFAANGGGEPALEKRRKAFIGNDMDPGGRRVTCQVGCECRNGHRRPGALSPLASCARVSLLSPRCRPPGINREPPSIIPVRRSHGGSRAGRGLAAA